MTDEIAKAQKETNGLKKYLESDYPLLVRFKGAAPGTFKHSQNVASLAESIAEEIGLDTTLMKVCAMYHDVGKMWNPKYFSENQDEDHNPHDELEQQG